jgi:hypothetical protein
LERLDAERHIHQGHTDNALRRRKNPHDGGDIRTAEVHIENSRSATCQALDRPARFL